MGSLTTPSPSRRRCRGSLRHPLRGLRFDRARVLLLSAAWAWARHGLEVYGRQLVCCSCLGVLIRSVNQVRTVGPTTHARGPRPGPDPASDAAHVLIHVGHCEAGRTHTPLQVTREPRDLGGPYSRPAPLQSALISHPTRRRRPRRRSPWLALHRSAEATAGA